MKRWKAAVVCMAGISLLLCSCGPTGSGSGSAQGFGGSVTVNATLLPEGGFSLTLASCTEKEGLGTLAAEAMLRRVNEAGTLAVDVVAGATVTSSAILSAAEAALVQAGLPEENLFANSADPYEYRYASCDVVVVGAGGAGLTAAINAAKEGARVVVVEKLGIPGGSTVRSGGVIAATGTDAQKYSYIEDSPTSFAASWLEGGGEASDQSRILGLCERSAGNLTFLREQGVSFSSALVSDSLNPQTPKRLHLAVSDAGEAGGGGIVAPLMEAAQELGVKFIYDARVYEILLGVGGETTGVRARLSGGGVLTVTAPSVILATGGFDRSTDLIYEFLGQKTFLSVTSPGNTGDGVELALAAGGAVDGNFGVMTDLYDFYGGTNGSADGILVTPEGERFVREDESSHQKAAALRTRGDFSRAYYILDRDGYTAAMEEGVRSGRILTADTVEALAQQLNAPWLSQVTTLYNALCQEGSDPYYGKDPSCLQPLDRGPFYAVPYEFRCFGTTGGVRVNASGQVVGASGAAIPGLWAAGECANGSFFAAGYPGPGYSLAQVIDTGRLAGSEAAGYALGGGYDGFDDAIYTTGDGGTVSVD